MQKQVKLQTNVFGELILKLYLTTLNIKKRKEVHNMYKS